MDDLYTQFLKKNNLDPVFFCQGPVLDEKKKMMIPEKLLGVRIADNFVPLNSSINNGRLFFFEIVKSHAEAKRDLHKWIKMYKRATIDLEGATMLVEELYQDVLSKLIWPLEYVTNEAQLLLEEFVPLATEMEALLDEFFDCTDAFIYALNSSENAIQSGISKRKEELNATTKVWADRAPLEVRATGRIQKGLFGEKELHIHADVRSSISSSQVNAQYMANDVTAHLGVNERRYKEHMVILQNLNDGIKSIIDGYIKRWKECIKNSQTKIRTISWSYVYATEEMLLARPDRVECLKAIFSCLDDPKDFAKMKKYIDYYGFDFEKELGEGICKGFTNYYIKEKEYDIGIDEEFYMYYYDENSLLACPNFYQYFKEFVKRMSKRTMEISYEKFSDIYVSQKDDIVAKLVDMIQNFPGIRPLQSAALLDVVWYNYYDMIHDYKNRDKYDPSGDEIEVPVFTWTKENK